MLDEERWMSLVVLVNPSDRYLVVHISTPERLAPQQAPQVSPIVGRLLMPSPSASVSHRKALKRKVLEEVQHLIPEEGPHHVI